MAHEKDTKPLDELLEEKMKEFESGSEKKLDKDMDEMIWELGDYESREAPQEAEEFEKEVPIEEELVEKEMVRTEKGRVYMKEPELTADKAPLQGKLVESKTLRIELEGVECEIVCGRISAEERHRIESYCRESDLTVSDIWYEVRSMTSVMGGTWRNWYKIDEFFHEIGLCCGDMKAFDINSYIDDEPAGKVDPDTISFHYKTLPKPKLKKGEASVSAGVMNKAKHIFRLDITGDFEPKKLALHFQDLKNIGIAKLLLTEASYGNRAMDYSHEFLATEDYLDVIFLM